MEIEPGDIVTRTGTDRMRVIGITHSGDLISTIVIKPDDQGVYSDGEKSCEVIWRCDMVSKGPRAATVSRGEI